MGWGGGVQVVGVEVVGGGQGMGIEVVELGTGIVGI